MQRLVKTIVLGMCLAAVLPAAHAAEQPKPRLTLEQRADKARIDSERIEQLQLEKARQAAKTTSAREETIKQQTNPHDWEVQQKLKAQKQFDERESREQKYLQEAKEAAAKERKIPKP